MSEKKAIRVAYGEALAALGEENEKVVVLDADLAHATMTATFANKFPQRFFNAGIAEANMIDMAAGLSTMGFIPFASTFAVFAGRCFDQIRNGVCYPGFNVKFGMTHAGITLGEDGGSHQAIEDVALMRSIPGMTILVPCDAKETWRAVKAAAEIQGPVYLRLARLPSPIFEEEMPFEVGKANTLREGTDVAVITCGIMVDECLRAAEQLAAKGISAAVINMHTIKPLDEEAVLRFASSCGAIVTVEEHSVIGGLGDAVGDVLLRNRCAIPFEKIGVQDRFGQSGKPDDVLAEYGLDVASIAARIEKFAASM